LFIPVTLKDKIIRNFYGIIVVVEALSGIDVADNPPYRLKESADNIGSTSDVKRIETSTSLIRPLRTSSEKVVIRFLIPLP
jgi:hypothetical protein